MWKKQTATTPAPAPATSEHDDMTTSELRILAGELRTSDTAVDAWRP
ncbi:MAG TPA: hypothetical protein VE258_19030 [Ktedonobacterales bacterium]|nr:hypothetical protein [Ktedonobacterales bacterium]